MSASIDLGQEVHQVLLRCSMGLDHPAIRLGLRVMSGLGLNGPRQVTYRRLMPDEDELRRFHLDRMGTEDRRSRFLGATEGGGALPDIIVGAFIEDSLRGVAELYTVPGRDVAEVAVTVEAQYQGQGIGGELVSRIMVLGRNRGIHKLVSHCLPTNARMQRIVRHAGGITDLDGGESTGLVRMEPANPSSLTQEWIDNAFTAYRAMLDWPRRLVAGRKSA